jgi:uncharacterized protein (TIGR00369 family)
MSAVLTSQDLVNGTDPAHTLARWQAREADLRARAQRPGLGRPEQFAGKTGMQIFEAMLAGDIPPPPITATLDFLLVEATPGRAEFQGRPLFAHYNPLGTVHGGWIATLLDSAVACAVHTTLPAGKTYTTLELKVNYVKAVTDKVPLVRAVGEVIHTGGKIGTSHGRLVGPDGTLFAHATTTCIVLDARP